MDRVRRMVLAGGLAVLSLWLPSLALAEQPAPRVHVVVMDKLKIGPMPADVRAGDVIEWVNHDLFLHSATARDGSFDVDIKPGATVRTTVTSGTFEIYCKYHPNMTATLVVK